MGTKWIDGCERSFQELKNRLVSAPVLALPTFRKEFEIYYNDSRFRLCVDERRQGDSLHLETAKET